MINRRQWLAATGSAIFGAAAAACVAKRTSETGFAQASVAASSSPPATTFPTTTEAVDWYDVREWGVEGRGFADTQSYFDRLPARAKDVVRPEVWGLSHHTAGMSVHFEAEGPALFIRYGLLKTELAMAHMPATGVSGVDLYIKDKGAWKWLSTHQPRDAKILAKLGTFGMPKGRHTYHINLPLYNGVTSMEIGVAKGASFTPIAPRKEKPLLFYGTSVTQGGCCSRPGMAFVAILGRRLDRPTLNFGFSGQGRTEVEVARFLAELDPAIFVIDTGANTPADQLGERTPAVVKVLREKHPTTPILIIDERPLVQGAIVPEVAAAHQKKHDVVRKAYDDLVAGGMKDLYWRTCDDILGADGEATVDGSHPTDLGMMRYADALEPDLRRILKG